MLFLTLNSLCNCSPLGSCSFLNNKKLKLFFFIYCNKCGVHLKTMIKYEIRFIVMITVVRAPNPCFMLYEPSFELLEMMAEIPISR